MIGTMLKERFLIQMMRVGTTKATSETKEVKQLLTTKRTKFMRNSLKAILMRKEKAMI